MEPLSLVVSTVLPLAEVHVLIGTSRLILADTSPESRVLPGLWELRAGRTGGANSLLVTIELHAQFLLASLCKWEA